MAGPGFHGRRFVQGTRRTRNASRGFPAVSPAIEPLEARLLLTGAPIDSNDIDALLTGLNDASSDADVVGLLGKIEGLGLLDQPLALTGQTIGEQLGLANVFDAGFVQPLAAEDFSAADLTTNDLVAFLEGSDVNRSLESGVKVEVRATAPEPQDDQIVLDVQFRAVRPVEYTLDLGSAGRELGLELVAGSEPTNVVDYGLDFDFQFGLDANKLFFISVDQIQAWAKDGLELTAEQPVPAGGSLSADLELSLVVNDDTDVSFVLAKSDYSDGADADDLASTLNSLLRIPLAQADIRDGIEVVSQGGRLAVVSTHPTARSLQLLGAEELGFASGRVVRGPIGNGPGSGPNLELGFVALSVVGGAVGLQASVDIDLDGTPEGTVDTDGNGRLDTSELGPSPAQLRPLVTLIGNGLGGASLPVDPGISGLRMDGAPMLILGSDDPFLGPDAVVISTEDLAQVEQLNQDATASINDGLQALARFGNDLGQLRQQNAGLDADLPGLNASIGEQLDLSDAFQRTLVGPVAAYFASTDHPTRRGVAEALRGIAGNLGRGLRVTVEPEVTMSRSSNRVTFDVALTVQRQTEVALDLGKAVADTGLLLGDAPAVTMITQLEFDATLGVNLTELPSSLESFFVQIQELTLDTHVDASLDTSGGLGLLSIDQITGTLDLAGSIEVHVGDGQPILGSDLQSRPADELVTLDPSVTASVVQFDVATSLDDSTAFAAEIELSEGGRLFDGAAALLPIDFGPLETFRNASPGAVLGALEQVKQWLSDFIASPSIDEAVPFVAGTQLSDVLDFGHPFEEQLVTPVRSLVETDGQNGLFIQDIVAALGTVVTDVDYDSANRELTLDINYVEAFEALSAQFGLDFDLAGLALLTTASELTLAPTIHGELTLGFELTPLGDGTPPLTADAPLDSLNGAMGVPIDPDQPDLKVQLRDGALFEVDLAGADTIADVLDVLNQASPGNLAARINDAETGLLLEDRTDTHSVDFSIAGINGSLAAISLGIAATDDDGDGVIHGLALHGDSFSDHVFISEPRISGDVLFSGSIDASASFGFVGVDITGGAIVDVEGAPSSLNVDVTFATAAGDPIERLTLSEVFDTLTDIEDSLVARADLSGAIGLALPLALSGGIGTLVAADARFEVMLDDLSVTSQGLDDLADFKDLTFTDFLDGLRRGLDLVANLETDAISGPGGSSHSFDIEIPVLDINLADVVGFAKTLDTFLDNLEQTGAGNLRAVGEVLEIALQTPIDFPNIAVTLPELVVLASEIRTYIDGLGEGGTGNAQDLGPVFESSLNLSVDLPDLEVGESVFQRFAGELAAYLVEQESGGVGTLQRLEEFVEDALGILDEEDDPNHDSTLVTLSIDQDPEQGLAIRLDLQVNQELRQPYPLHFDLAQIDLGIVGDLVDAGLDLSGGGTLDLTAGVNASLSLGLDVSDAPNFRPFLYDYSDQGTPANPDDDTGTMIRVSAGAMSDDVHFNAAFGPLGVSISEGSVRIGSDVDESSGAEYLFAQGTGGARRYLIASDGSETGASITDDLSSEVHAIASVDLPIAINGFNIDVDPLVVSYDLTRLSDPPQIASTPDFSAALARIESEGVGSNLLAMVGGWKGVMDLVLDGMRGEVFGVPLPLIGDALKDEADFIERVRDSVLANLEDAVDDGIDAVQQAIFDALGPDGGIGFLKDFNDETTVGDGLISKDDVRVTRQGEDLLIPSGVQFDVILGKDLPTINLPSGFDLGLPGLALDVDGEVQIDMSFDWHVGFGLSRDEGVYFDTSRSAEDPELVVRLDVTTPGLSAVGQLGFLQLNVFDLYDITGVENDKTRFTAVFGVDLVDPGTNELDERLSISEIATADISEMLVPDFDATADVNLRVVTSVGGSDLFPQFRADFLVDWSFDSPESIPESLGFTNVQLNLGSFLDGLAGDVLSRVQKVLEPVQPVIHVLTTPLPVVSDLSGSDVTLVDLARLFGRADVADFAQSVIDINNLITGLPADASGIWIDFGSFDIDSALARRSGDASGARRGNPQLKPINLEIPTTEPMNQIGNSSPSGGKWVDNLAGAKQGSLRFPLIESPFTAFQYLLGNDIDLFVYDAPTLGVDFTYSQFFPVPPIPILGAEIAGRVYATADFQAGFDTTGLRRFGETQNFLDVFDGFFVSDVDEFGKDVVEVKFGGSLTAGATINILAAQAGVRGGVFANVDFNLHDFVDPGTGQADGKIRAGELARNLALGPIHIFDVAGKVDAGLEAFLDVDLLLFQIHETYKIAEVTLLDFDVERPNPEDLPELASQSGGTLTLNLTDGDDTFLVLPGASPGGVIVESKGIRSDEFIGVSLILGDAGSGHDTITINPNVVIPVTLLGGIGNDKLFAGGGPAELRGGPGHDQLTGGPKDDQLYGDDIGGIGGEDFLLGGEGNDLLVGGPEADRLEGGRGDDTLLGGQGSDELFGGRGNDRLEGEAGDDTLNGQRDDDLLLGGSGDDQIHGGPGDDMIEGGDNDDNIFGDDGFDTIYGDDQDGGTGNDYIEGGSLNDTIFAGAGMDTVLGGTGNDTIDGGTGDDMIRGQGGSDTLMGGPDNDVIFADDDEQPTVEAVHTIDGGGGNDHIFGGLSDNIVFGGAGNDTILTHAGHDIIEAGPGDDTVTAGAGDDFVAGGTGNDRLRGGNGDDAIFGGTTDATPQDFDLGHPDKFAASGDASRFENPPGVPDIETTYRFAPKFLFGQSDDGQPNDGADTLLGEQGTDWLFGGSDRDFLLGGTGNDYLDAGAGLDVNVFGGSGDDIVRGGANDDVVHGGEGIDQVFGGSGSDRVYGDQDTSGQRPVDGQLQDLQQRLLGGAGDDFLYAWAAGDGTDLATSGDELHGGSGADFLFGNLRAEKLFGDQGNDFLGGDALDGPDYADSGSPAFNIDQTTLGAPIPRPIGSDDLLVGGPGGDQLYGGGGNDRLWGGDDSDWLEGQDGDDSLYAGSGIDMLVVDVHPNYTSFHDDFDGHAGNAEHGDTPDDNATDILLITGTNNDDEILLSQESNGLEGNDEEFLLRVDITSREGNVELFSQTTLADWRGSTGDALVEQFRVAGLAGDDTIFFVQGEEALDLSDLFVRSSDFVTTIDGGTGHDVLSGTDGRDRIDGGRGSDTVFGFGGDDRLWGDQGAGTGSSTDHDVIFAGQGNDDVVGGRGTNDLYAWSVDPNPIVTQLRFADGQRGTPSADGSQTALIGGLPAREDGVFTSDAHFSLRMDGGPFIPVVFLAEQTRDNTNLIDLIADLNTVLPPDVTAELAGDESVIQLVTEADSIEIRIDHFGVFVTVEGDLSADNGDLDGDGSNDNDVSLPLHTVEDSGLNRILGMANDDRLFGGTGLDFLFGGDGEDLLYNRHGALLENLDGGLGNDDGWKEYARSTGRVWYVGGSNLDDIISVDFVTEPGLLQGHHLVTRLTENDGNFTFAAQVRLDFSATDDDGNLIWDISDELVDIDALSDDDPFARAEALGKTFSDADPGRLAGLLPPEGDFLAIVVDALRGNDHVTVGPTVQKTVWVDAGPGDDRVEIISGKPILTDQTEGLLRNDTLDTAADLTGPAVLVAPESAVANGVLSGDAQFQLIIDGEIGANVVVPAAATDGSSGTSPANTSRTDLIQDINDALAAEGVLDRVTASLSGDRIVLSTTSAGAAAQLVISVPPRNVARTELGLQTTTDPVENFPIADGSIEILRDVIYAGLTIDHPDDEDFYRFQLGVDAVDLDPKARLSVSSLDPSDAIDITVHDAEGNLLPQADTLPGIPLAGLEPQTTYVLKVKSDLIPTIYSLHFDLIGDTQPAIVDLAARSDFPRRDVLLGGTGNDILAGGPGEDWIFGGPENDMLTGGADSGASDLLFGEGGDDTFQIIPDRLPLIAGTEMTFLPTFSDRLDGGVGEDRALFLGGDLDRNGIPVDDFVALRFNRLLQRYEWTSLIWDINNQQFFTQQVDVPATITSTGPAPESGRIDADATWQLQVNGTQVNVTISATSTQTNQSVDDLVVDVAQALAGPLDDAGIPGAVGVGRIGSRLILSTAQTGSDAMLQITSANDVAATQLQLPSGDAVLGAADQERFEQFYHFYTVRDIEHTVIDTRAGDDVVHADSEFVFPATTSEWGISPGDFQAGARIASLEILGGDGDDRVFGGPQDDRIDGGDGSDLIMGGGGDDMIEGGPGDDLLFGATTLEPDRFEFQTRDGVTGLNDVFQFAANLGTIHTGQAIHDLTFHDGDPVDWFFFDVPDSLNQFAGQHGALVRSGSEITSGSLLSAEDVQGDMIRARKMVAGADGATLEPSEQYFPVTLFLAENAAAGSGIDPVPVDVLGGVPDSWLLRVDNTEGLNAHHFQLEFVPPLEEVVDVVVEQVVADGLGYALTPDDLRIEVNGFNVGGQAIVIPLGDINGDAQDDFILSVADDATDPRTGLTRTFAKIFFGNDVRLNPDLGVGGSETVLLVLPEPVLADAALGRSVISSPGDFDGDGLDDLAITATGPGSAQEVYLLFGRRHWADLVDVVQEAATVPGFRSFDPVSDTFSRTDGTELGSTEIGDLVWTQHATNGVSASIAEIVSGELRVTGAAGAGSSDPGQAVLAVDAPNVNISMDMRFDGLQDPPESGTSNTGGLVLRKPSASSGISSTSGDGQIDINFAASGGFLIRQNVAGNLQTLYADNPFAPGQTLDTLFSFQGPGSLPSTVGGLPFDADGDGVLEQDESFRFGVLLDGSSLVVQINGQPLVSATTLTAGSTPFNFLSLWKNRTNSAAGLASADPSYDNLRIEPGEAVGVTLKQLSGDISLASAGDANNDPYDDLLITDDTGTHLFLGRDREAGWFAGTPVPLEQSNNNVWDFENVNTDIDVRDNAHGFLFDDNDTGHTSDRFFRIEEGRLEFHQETGSFSNGGSDNLRLIAQTAEIDLTGVQSATLSFDSFLQTEHNAGVDIAKVQISTSGIHNGVDIPRANNQPGGQLIDGMIPLDDGESADPSQMQTVKLSLDPFVGMEDIHVVFHFETVDDFQNDIFGWAIDNIRITTDLVPDDADVIFSNADHAEGVGDLNGDGADDFGILIGENLQINLGDPNQGVSFSTRDVGSVRGQRLRPVGDLDSDGGTTFNADTILVTGTDGSTFVFDASTAAPTVVSVDAVNLKPIGNFDGDVEGFEDFASAAVERTGALDKNVTANVHQVTEIFLGGGSPQASFADNFSHPALVLESSSPAFFAEGEFEATESFVGVLRSRNGEGTPNIAVATPFSSVLNVIRGGPVTLSEGNPNAPLMEGVGAILPTESFRFQLGTPVSASQAGDQTTQGVDLVSSNPILLSEAFSLEGVRQDEALAASRPVGDVNGDGFGDFVMEGQSTAYVLFGPLRLDGHRKIDREADILLDRRQPVGDEGGELGTLAHGKGDVSGDGIDDYIFLSDENCAAAGGSCDVVLRIVQGAPGLDRHFDDAAFWGVRDITVVHDPDHPPAAHLVNWDGDHLADLLVVGSRTDTAKNDVLGHLLLGKDINDPGSLNAAPTVEIRLDSEARLALADDMLDPIGFDRSNVDPEIPSVTTTMVGDVNGDGLDDVVIASAEYLRFTGALVTRPEVGRAFLLFGRTSVPESIELSAESDLIFQDLALGATVSALGDLNGDGYDELAIGRSREDGGNLAGGLFVFAGAPDANGLNGPPQIRDTSDALLTIRRAEAATLAGGTALRGSLFATAGDFDHDGSADLVIGESERRLVNGLSDQRGTVFVILSTAENAAPLVGDLSLSLTNHVAGRVIRGQFGTDRFGTLPTAPHIDFNGDGVDDLTVGAAGADGVIGGSAADAGRVFMVSGSVLPQTLPQTSHVLANSPLGPFLMDRQTGTLTFSDAKEMVLKPGEESRWYRFTTLGDGRPGDTIRLSPDVDVDTLLHATSARTELPDGTLEVGDQVMLGGPGDTVGILQFDLDMMRDALRDPQTLARAVLHLDVSTDAVQFAGPVQVDNFVASGPNAAKLFFTALDEHDQPQLWVSDGTFEGTTLVRDPNGQLDAATIANLIDVNGTLFFTANPVPSEARLDLWKVDEITGFPAFLARIPDNASQFVAGETVLFFAADDTNFSFFSDDSTEGSEVWRSDGTVTEPLRSDSSPRRAGSDPQQLTAVGDNIYFSAVNNLNQGRPDPGSIRILFSDTPLPNNSVIDTSRVGDNGGTLGALHRAPQAMVGFDGVLVMVTLNPSGISELTATSGAKFNSPNTGTPGFEIEIIQQDAITNPHGYTIVPGAFQFDGQESDGLYFFADDPSAASPAAHSIFEIHRTGTSNDNPPEPIFTATELLAVGDNPDQLTYSGGSLFFSALIEGTRQLAMASLSPAPTELTPIVTNSNGDANPSDLTDVSGTLFFTSLDDTGIRRLYRIVNSQPELVADTVRDPTDLVAASGRLFFKAEGALWVTDGNVGGTYALQSLESPETTVQATVIDSTSSTATTSLRGRQGRVHIDITSQLRDAIEAGQSTVGIRLENLGTSYGEAPGSVGGEETATVILSDRFDTSGTGLELLSNAQGVVGDLVDVQGRVLASHQVAFDLRDVEAGTYFLKVTNPRHDAQSEPLPFTIEIDAPVMGLSHPATDRDFIQGGDGDDRIVGGPGLDRLFGESGSDDFRAVTTEVRDLAEAAGESVETPGSSDTNERPLAVEVLKPDETDPALRAAVARALGIPVTLDHNGQPYVNAQLFANEVAQLTRLDLSGTGIRDLNGLQYLPNLRILNLAQNDTGVSPSDATLSVSQIPKTLDELEYVSLASSGLQHLDISDLVAFRKLKHLDLKDNNISDLTTLAGIYLIDDGDPGYTEIGQGQGNLNPVDHTVNHDYRFFVEPDTNATLAEWTQAELPAGAYQVQVTWPTSERRSSQVVYQVLDGEKLLDEVTVNQQLPPAGEPFGGAIWHSLGVYSVMSDQLAVRLLNAVEGIVAADAVRLISLPTPSLTLETLDLRGNPLNSLTRDEILPVLDARIAKVWTSPDSNADVQPKINDIPPQLIINPVVHLSLANQAELDALGIPVYFTADTDVAGFVADIQGDTLTLSAPADFSGLARIEVTVHSGTREQPTGRTDRFAFDLNVDSGAIYGNLYHDLDQGAGRQDVPLDGFTVELVSFDPVEVRYDADMYDHGDPIVDATGRAVFSHVPSGGQIYAAIGSDAGVPAYSLRLEDIDFPVWMEGDTLRVDFTETVSSVSIEATEFSTEGASVQVTAFDTTGNTIDLTREILEAFDFQTVRVNRSSEAAIASVEIVGIKTFPESNQQVFMGLANLAVTYEVQSLPRTTYTDANGDYRFGALPLDRRFVITPQVPDDWQLSAPQSRLFDGTSGDIVVTDYDFGLFKPLFAGNDRTVAEGETVSFSVASDGNPNWQVVRDDGSQVADGHGLAFQFAAPDNGTYTVTVSDDTASDIVIVQATNRAPQLIAVGDQAVNEGELLALDPIATFSDSGFGDTETFEYEIDWGDGSPRERGEARIDAAGGPGVPATGSIGGAHRYASEGEYLVSISLDDDDGGGDAASFTVRVANVATRLETVSASVDADRRVPVGTDVIVSGTFDDPGDDFWTGTVDYGDGAKLPLVISSDRNFTSHHVYRTPGRFTVIVSLDDENGTPATRSLMVEVYVIGDMDRDDIIDFDDIGSFALGLTNPTAYRKQFGAPPTLHGDTDGDGDIDFDDIPGFAEKLLRGVPQRTAAAAREAVDPPTPSETVFARLDDFVSQTVREGRPRERNLPPSNQSPGPFTDVGPWQRAVDQALDDWDDAMPRRIRRADRQRP